MLSDERVVRVVKRDVVPVAVNLYKIREAKGAAGDFFREVQKQKPEMYQGVYVVDPDGKVLAVQSREPEKPKSWAGDLLEVLADGVKAYGTVTPRKAKWVDPQPFRGVGTTDDGGVVLAVTTRWMLLGLEKRGLSKPTFDSVELTDAQAQSLSLAESPKGTTWQVPAGVVKQFHKVLSATSDKSSLPRANEVTDAKLEGRVERVADGVAYLTFAGKVSGSHLGDLDPNVGKRNYSEMALTGVGTCEEKSGKLLSLLLVGEGVYKAFPPYDEARKFGAAVEWRRKR